MIGNKVNDINGGDLLLIILVANASLPTIPESQFQNVKRHFHGNQSRLIKLYPNLPEHVFNWSIFSDLCRRKWRCSRGFDAVCRKTIKWAVAYFITKSSTHVK